MSGRSRIGKRGLGLFSVKGRRRVPRPAASIIALIDGMMPAASMRVKKGREGRILNIECRTRKMKGKGRREY
jgi:hypothetical protein